MNNDNKTNESSGDVIDFNKQKSVHVHERKERKLKEMQEAFKKALPLKKTRTKKKKSKKKK